MNGYRCITHVALFQCHLYRRCSQGAMLLRSCHVHTHSGLRSQKLRGLALHTIQNLRMWEWLKIMSPKMPQRWMLKNPRKKWGGPCSPRPCAASLLLLEPGVLMGQPDVLCAKMIWFQYNFTWHSTPFRSTSIRVAMQTNSSIFNCRNRWLFCLFNNLGHCNAFDENERKSEAAGSCPSQNLAGLQEISHLQPAQSWHPRFFRGKRSSIHRWPWPCQPCEGLPPHRPWGHWRSRRLPETGTLQCWWEDPAESAATEPPADTHCAGNYPKKIQILKVERRGR